MDWTNQKITFTRCPPECSKPKPPKEPDDKVTLEPGDGIYATFIPEEWAAEYIQVMTTPSQQFAQQAQSDTSEQSFTDLIPEAYCNFEDIFSKDAFNELPPRKVWDHAIDLIPDAELPHSRTFPLSPTEQQELDMFLQENLANGWCHNPCTDLSHGAWTFSEVGTRCTATGHMTSLLVYSPFSQELSSLSLNLILDIPKSCNSLGTR